MACLSVHVCVCVTDEELEWSMKQGGGPAGEGEGTARKGVCVAPQNAKKWASSILLAATNPTPSYP